MIRQAMTPPPTTGIPEIDRLIAAALAAQRDATGPSLATGIAGPKFADLLHTRPAAAKALLSSSLRLGSGGNLVDALRQTIRSASAAGVDSFDPAVYNDPQYQQFVSYLLGSPKRYTAAANAGAGQFGPTTESPVGKARLAAYAADPRNVLAANILGGENVVGAPRHEQFADTVKKFWSPEAIMELADATFGKSLPNWKRDRQKYRQAITRAVTQQQMRMTAGSPLEGEPGGAIGNWTAFGDQPDLYRMMYHAEQFQTPTITDVKRIFAEAGKTYPELNDEGMQSAGSPTIDVLTAFVKDPAKLPALGDAWIAAKKRIEAEAGKSDNAAATRAFGEASVIRYLVKQGVVGPQALARAAQLELNAANVLKNQTQGAMMGQGPKMWNETSWRWTDVFDPFGSIPALIGGVNPEQAGMVDRLLPAATAAASLLAGALPAAPKAAGAFQRLLTAGAAGQVVRSGVGLAGKGLEALSQAERLGKLAKLAQGIRDVAALPKVASAGRRAENISMLIAPVMSEAGKMPGGLNPSNVGNVAYNMLLPGRTLLDPTNWSKLAHGTAEEKSAAVSSMLAGGVMQGGLLLGLRGLMSKSGHAIPEEFLGAIDSELAPVEGKTYYTAEDLAALIPKEIVTAKRRIGQALLPQAAAEGATEADLKAADRKGAAALKKAAKYIQSVVGSDASDLTAEEVASAAESMQRLRVGLDRQNAIERQRRSLVRAITGSDETELTDEQVVKIARADPNLQSAIDQYIKTIHMLADVKAENAGLRDTVNAIRPEVFSLFHDAMAKTNRGTEGTLDELGKRSDEKGRLNYKRQPEGAQLVNFTSKSAIGHDFSDWVHQILGVERNATGQGPLAPNDSGQYSGNASELQTEAANREHPAGVDVEGAANRGGGGVSESGNVPEVAAREPWQMTREEFDSSVVYRGTSEANTTRTRQHWMGGDSGRYWSTVPGKALEYAGAGKNGRLRIALKSNVPPEALKGGTEQGRSIPDLAVIDWTDDLTAAQMKDPHRILVERALREGKPVPPEVLADYPDLAPKPASVADTVRENVQAALATIQQEMAGKVESGEITEAEAKKAVNQAGAELGAQALDVRAQEVVADGKRLAEITKKLQYRPTTIGEEETPPKERAALERERSSIIERLYNYARDVAAAGEDPGLAAMSPEQQAAFTEGTGRVRLLAQRRGAMALRALSLAKAKLAAQLEAAKKLKVADDVIQRIKRSDAALDRSMEAIAGGEGEAVVETLRSLKQQAQTLQTALESLKGDQRKAAQAQLATLTSEMETIRKVMGRGRLPAVETVPGTEPAEQRGREQSIVLEYRGDKSVPEEYNQGLASDVAYDAFRQETGKPPQTVDELRAWMEAKAQADPVWETMLKRFDREVRDLVTYPPVAAPKPTDVGAHVRNLKNTDPEYWAGEIDRQARMGEDLLSKSVGEHDQAVRRAIAAEGAAQKAEKAGDENAAALRAEAERLKSAAADDLDPTTTLSLHQGTQATVDNLFAGLERELREAMPSETKSQRQTLGDLVKRLRERKAEIDSLYKASASPDWAKAGEVYNKSTAGRLNQILSNPETGKKVKLQTTAEIKKAAGDKAAWRWAGIVADRMFPSVEALAANTDVVDVTGAPELLKGVVRDTLYTAQTAKGGKLDTFGGDKSKQQTWIEANLRAAIDKRLAEYNKLNPQENLTQEGLGITGDQIARIASDLATEFDSVMVARALAKRAEKTRTEAPEEQAPPKLDVKSAGRKSNLLQIAREILGLRGARTARVTAAAPDTAEEALGTAVRSAFTKSDRVYGNPISAEARASSEAQLGTALAGRMQAQGVAKGTSGSHSNAVKIIQLLRMFQRGASLEEPSAEAEAYAEMTAQPPGRPGAPIEEQAAARIPQAVGEVLFTDADQVEEAYNGITEMDAARFAKLAKLTGHPDMTKAMWDEFVREKGPAFLKRLHTEYDRANAQDLQSRLREVALDAVGQAVRETEAARAQRINFHADKGLSLLLELPPESRNTLKWAAQNAVVQHAEPNIDGQEPTYNDTAAAQDLAHMLMERSDLLHLPDGVRYTADQANDVAYALLRDAPGQLLKGTESRLAEGQGYRFVPVGLSVAESALSPNMEEVARTFIDVRARFMNQYGYDPLGKEAKGGTLKTEQGRMVQAFHDAYNTIVEQAGAATEARARYEAQQNAAEAAAVSARVAKNRTAIAAKTEQVGAAIKAVVTGQVDNLSAEAKQGVKRVWDDIISYNSSIEDAWSALDELGVMPDFKTGKAMVDPDVIQVGGMAAGAAGAALPGILGLKDDDDRAWAKAFAVVAGSLAAYYGIKTGLKNKTQLASAFGSMKDRMSGAALRLVTMGRNPVEINRMAAEIAGGNANAARALGNLVSPELAKLKTDPANASIQQILHCWTESIAPNVKSFVAFNKGIRRTTFRWVNKLFSAAPQAQQAIIKMLSNDERDKVAMMFRFHGRALTEVVGRYANDDAFMNAHGTYATLPDQPVEFGDWRAPRTRESARWAADKVVSKQGYLEEMRQAHGDQWVKDFETSYNNLRVWFDDFADEGNAAYLRAGNALKTGTRNPVPYIKEYFPHLRVRTNSSSVLGFFTRMLSGNPLSDEYGFLVTGLSPDEALGVQGSAGPKARIAGRSGAQRPWFLYHQTDDPSHIIETDLRKILPRYTTEMSGYACSATSRALFEKLADMMEGNSMIKALTSVYKGRESMALGNARKTAEYLRQFSESMSGMMVGLDAMKPDVARTAREWNRITSSALLGLAPSTAVAQTSMFPNAVSHVGPMGAIYGIACELMRPLGLRDTPFDRSIYKDVQWQRPLVIKGYDTSPEGLKRMIADARNNSRVLGFFVKLFEKTYGRIAYNGAYMNARWKGFSEQAARDSAEFKARLAITDRSQGGRTLFARQTVWKMIFPFMEERANNIINLTNDLRVGALGEGRLGYHRAFVRAVEWAATSWLVNQALDRLTGHRVLPDPIELGSRIADAFDSSKVEANDRAATIMGALIDTAAAMPYTSAYALPAEEILGDKPFVKNSEMRRVGISTTFNPLLPLKAIGTQHGWEDFPKLVAATAVRSFVPAGAQFMKTAGAISAMRAQAAAPGVTAVRSLGTNTYSAPILDTPMDKIRALLFGTGSTTGMEERYNRVETRRPELERAVGGNRPVTGKDIARKIAEDLASRSR